MRRLCVLLIVLVLLAGCAQPTPTPRPTEAAQSAPKAAATTAPQQQSAKEPTEAPSVETGRISVAGSTTVQPLAEKLAEAFIAKNAGVQIDVQGGGSSVGVKSAGQGQVDVGMASREVKDAELQEFPNIEVIAIAYDGIAIVAHPGVAVADLSKEDVQRIFSGEITNWNEVGGPNAMIVVVSREEGSGTRGAFEELVMDGELISGGAILLPSNGAVRTTVSTTPNAVAYVSFGYLDASVKALSVDGVAPTAANAANGSYPVVRPLNMMIQKEPNDLTKAWLDFIMSADGQAIAVEDGYISALPTEEPVAAEATLSGEISVAGSTTVQPIAEKLAEAFRALHGGVSVNVQGGGSSVGVKSAAQGQVDLGMASREVKSSELAEFPDLEIHTIAYDGIAIAANTGVAVDSLTKDQVRAIFSGEITNWNEVGGPNAMIVVVSREEGSGTRGAFEELVMDDALISGAAILLPSNGAVRTTISTTPNAVGYVSFGYLDDSVKTLSVDGVAPTAANAANGSYPVVRPLLMLSKGEPTPLASAWLDFIMSADGQALVVEDGYIAVP